MRGLPLPPPAGATDASNNVEITRTAPNAGHIASNGVNYHYQIYGRAHRDSTPLLLLHGSLEQIETFGPVLSGLAALNGKSSASTCKVMDAARWGRANST